MANNLTLADAVVSANTGLDAIKRAPIVEEDTGIKCLRIQDVNQEKDFVSWGNTLVEKRNFEKFQLKESDILIARTGGSVGSNRYIYQELQAVYNNGLIRIRVNTKKHNPKFIYYLLQTKQFESHINGIAYSTSAQPNMKIRDFLRFEFKELGLNVENTIEEILSSLDAKIELNRLTNQTLEKMAQALFKSWFVDFDPVIDNALAAGNVIPAELQERAELRKTVIAQRATNPKLKPLPDSIQQLFASEFEESELGWIPKGWLIKSVDEAVIINPRVSLPKGTVAPFADMKALPTDGYSINEVIKKPYAGGAKFQQGDVLLARITPCLENGKTGLVDFLAKDEVGFGSTEFIVMRAKGSVGASFVACLARYVNFRKHCIQSMVGSSGRQRVQSACFGSYFLNIPSNEKILNSFQKITASMFSNMTLNNEETKSLTNLRDLLLPKLISGEIDLSQLSDKVS